MFAGAWTVSSHPISDDQLSKGRDMEYGSVIRKIKHSRALPIYSAINPWLGDLRGIYGRDKSRGAYSLGQSGRDWSHACPGQCGPIKGWKGEEKAPFSVSQLKQIADEGGRDKRKERAERQKQRRGKVPYSSSTLGCPQWNVVNDCAGHIRLDLFLMLHKAIAYTPKRQD